MKNIIIIGSGGHAKVVIDILEKTSEYQISGLIDDFRNTGEDTYGYPILGNIASLDKVAHQYAVHHYIIAVGDNYQREAIAKKISHLCPSLTAASAIHPSSQIGKDVVIGHGSVIAAGAAINPSTVIGAHCIINTNSSVDHDCQLAPFSSVAPGAVLGGHVCVGKASAVCIGATVIENRSIGNHSLLGAGSVLLTDLPDCVVAHGIPAKKIRIRKENEKYI